MEKAGKRCERFAWIEACLRYRGEFGASDKAAYGGKFHLSRPQVSKDQADFLKKMEAVRPGFVEWKNGKLVRLGAGSSAKPALSVPELREWLKDAAGKAYVSIPDPRRSEPSGKVVSHVLEGIAKRRALAMSYESRSSGMSIKIISPHVIVDIVNRMHIRGFDHDKGIFVDLVIDRIGTISVQAPGSKPVYHGPEDDHEWHEFETLEITVRDDIPEGTRAAARTSMGKQDRRTFQERKALTGYLVDIDGDPQNPFRELFTVRRISN